jgi:hypothetical protein
MDQALMLNIVGWLWVLASLGALATVVLLADEASGSIRFLPQVGPGVVAISAMASLVAALHVVGYPAVGLWAWRIVSVLYVLFAIFVATNTGSDAAERAGVVVNVALALLTSIASFVIRQVFVPAAASSSPAPAKSIIAIQGVQLWHGLALSILGLGTVVFLFLFIRMIERGVPPQVESQWGGIGGGMGGWRMSASLTYLVTALVFGVLFAFFIVQLKAA